MSAAAQTRERPAPTGRPFTERIPDAPDKAEGTSEVTQLRDPQRIAGSAIAKYGKPLALAIACEIVSTVDFIEYGPSAGKPIPEPFVRSARTGIAACRAVQLEVAERMKPQPGPRIPPPGGPHG